MAVDQTRVDLNGKRVLVTGGTGFIGGRLTERLILDCGAEVRTLVRNFSRATRIARFPVNMFPGDVLDTDSLEAAAQGCDVIFNCMAATDGSEAKQRHVNFDGTRNVFEAALRAGCRRVVHISTIMVYGAAADGDLDETAPRNYSGDVYSDSKLDAEKLAFEYAEKRRLPVTVIQPTVVFGPFGPAWTTRVLGDVKNGRVILIDGGSGLCNAVYVDDIVSALMLAAVRDEAVGEAFLISGATPVTWREFYGAYEKMLGCCGTASLSMKEAVDIYHNVVRRKSILRESLNALLEDSDLRWRVKETVEISALRRFAQAVTPAKVRTALKRRLTGDPAAPSAKVANGHVKPILPAHPSALRYQAARTHVRINKARKLLGYEPQFNFATGMELTAEWARWAGLLGNEGGPS